ncbi:MAG: HIT family protein [Candidimonas sp.]|jgi:diadenosine tetraphosphate (Ap4A) HIT family hydrolase
MSDTAVNASPGCPLCRPQGETVLWERDPWRVVLVDDERFPGYTRLIHARHVREMSDLPDAQRAQCMEIVSRVEIAQRRVLQPDKINLAQFGNMVAHLHWHIIPRWEDDPHFPEAAWGPAATRDAAERRRWSDKARRLRGRLDEYRRALDAQLS